MAADEQIHAEVAYGTPAHQWLIAVAIAPSTSVRMAICQSGILQCCPEIDLARDSVGKFGNVVQLDDLVYEGDRIEIYRALRADPKAARRQRAERARATRGRCT